MAQTPASSTVSYLPVAEFLKRCDQRTVAQLVSDTGTGVPPSSLATDPNLAAALLDASGMLEAHLVIGQRYVLADIQALVASPCAGQALIYRILADLTTGLLYERRPNVMKEPPPAYARAQEWLEKLASGGEVLPLLETEAAGLMNEVVMQEADWANLNLTTRQTRRYFGARSKDRFGIEACGGHWPAPPGD